MSERLSDEEIREMRKADPIPGGAQFPDGLPRGGPLAVIPYGLFQRLLDEVERHRTNLQALESNLAHHPGSMTTERMLSSVREAQKLMWLEVLT